MDSMEYLRWLLRGHFGITESDLSCLQSLLTVRGLDKGEPLPVRGGTSPIAGIVTRGCLRIFFTESDGSDRVLYFAPEGWLVPGVEPLTGTASNGVTRSEEHTSELQSQSNLVCRLLLEKKN